MNERILQLGKFYPIGGGVEKVEYDLTLGLSERGIKCDMMCAAAEGRSYTKKLNGNARLICCGALAKYAATMISPNMIQKLYKSCDKYDIIHIHHPDPMACMALYMSGYEGKVVLHWHSDIIKQKHLIKLFKPFQNWLLQRADIIVGTTPVYIKESLFLSKVQDKVTYLPIGVYPCDGMVGKPNPIREQYDDKKIIFSLGRLVEYKGYEYLIRSAAHLSEDYVVLIGGTGPLRKKLQALIDELQLNDRVKLLGFIEDADLEAYYAACDIFCLSSVSKTEAFGIVQIEAMSCGKPIVATTIEGSGTHWVNAHGESGLNVPPCDERALAAAFVEIAGDKERYAKFCEGARKRYEEVFTYEKMIDNCIEIYKNLKE